MFYSVSYDYDDSDDDDDNHDDTVDTDDDYNPSCVMYSMPTSLTFILL